MAPATVAASGYSRQISWASTTNDTATPRELSPKKGVSVAAEKKRPSKIFWASFNDNDDDDEDDEDEDDVDDEDDEKEEERCRSVTTVVEKLVQLSPPSKLFAIDPAMETSFPVGATSAVGTLGSDQSAEPENSPSRQDNYRETSAPGDEESEVTAAAQESLQDAAGSTMQTDSIPAAAAPENKDSVTDHSEHDMNLIPEQREALVDREASNLSKEDPQKQEQSSAPMEETGKEFQTSIPREESQMVPVPTAASSNDSGSAAEEKNRGCAARLESSGNSSNEILLGTDCKSAASSEVCMKASATLTVETEHASMSDATPIVSASSQSSELSVATSDRSLFPTSPDGNSLEGKRGLSDGTCVDSAVGTVEGLTAEIVFARQEQSNNRGIPDPTPYRSLKVVATCILLQFLSGFAYEWTSPRKASGALLLFSWFVVLLGVFFIALSSEMTKR